MILSKTLDPADYAHLDEELRAVDTYEQALRHQHPHRRWEYALALHAISQWAVVSPRLLGPLYDVGGAGSPFYYMLRDWTKTYEPVIVIDPALVNGYTLEEYLAEGEARLSPIVTCISVLEHVQDLDRFCYHLSCLLAPGGLLVLTMDYWNRCGPDTAQNREQRARIFCPKTLLALRNQCVLYQLTPFGGVDPAWHGAHVHDYSFASLVLEKRR